MSDDPSLTITTDAAIHVEATIDDGALRHRLGIAAPRTWPGVPRAGDRIAGAKGEVGLNAEIKSVLWHADGQVTIDLGVIEDENLATQLPLIGWAVLEPPTERPAK